MKTSQKCGESVAQITKVLPETKGNRVYYLNSTQKDFNDRCIFLISELAEILEETADAELFMDELFDGFVCSKAFQERSNKEESTKKYRSIRNALDFIAIFFNKWDLGAWKANSNLPTSSEKYKK